MFILVEAFITQGLQDRPDLGAAMLLASCRQAGIPTRLVSGQVSFLKNIFVDDSEEAWNLLFTLKPHQAHSLGLDGYRDYLNKKGRTGFKKELLELYQDIIKSKSVRYYLDAARLNDFQYHFKSLLGIYCYYSSLPDQKINFIERYVSEILSNKPSSIGFSLQNDSCPISRLLRKRIKELTKLPIILGGPFSAYLDSKRLARVFEKGYCDYLVIGAGEFALPALLDTLRSRGQPKRIANVCYRQNSSLKLNPPEVIKDLNVLSPPDFSQFNLDLYPVPVRLLPLQTARGCSWLRCAFCVRRKLYGGAHKAFNIARVLEDICYLRDSYQCRHFVLHDDELPPERARDLSQGLVNKKISDTYFYAWARPVAGYNNNNLLRLMRKAGFVSLSWGVESGSQKVLDSMHKGTSLRQISQILKKGRRNKIGNTCFLLFGFPGEKQSQANKTIDFIKKHSSSIESVHISEFSLMPFSAVATNPQRWGMTFLRNGRYITDSGMSAEEVKEFVAKLNAEIHLGRLHLSCRQSQHLMFDVNMFLTFFLMYSHRLMDEALIVRLLKKGDIGGIFPIIFGRVVRSKRRFIFYPFNLTRSVLLNSAMPEKAIVLDKLEREIVCLTDAILSVEDIIAKLSAGRRAPASSLAIKRRCLDFYQRVFSQHWGLGFKKSWKIR